MSAAGCKGPLLQTAPRRFRPDATILLALVAWSASACTGSSDRPGGEPVAATAAVQISPAPAATDGPSGPTPAAGDLPASLTGRVWQLDGFADGAAVTDAIEGSEPTLTFAGSAVAGNGGCNSFSGPAIVGAAATDGQALRFPQTAVTQMACADPLLNDQEERLMSYLARVARFRLIDAEAMVLEDETGRIGLLFTATSSQP